MCRVRVDLVTFNSSPALLLSISESVLLVRLREAGSYAVLASRSTRAKHRSYSPTATSICRNPWFDPLTMCHRSTLRSRPQAFPTTSSLMGHEETGVKVVLCPAMKSKWNTSCSAVGRCRKIRSRVCIRRKRLRRS